MATLSIGPFDLVDGTGTQTQWVFQTWDYMQSATVEFNTALMNGQVKVIFVSPAQLPYLGDGVHRAWGYTTPGNRTTKINNSLNRKQAQYTIAHEFTHMLVGDVLDGTSKTDIMALMIPDAPDGNSSSWLDGNYQWKPSENFADEMAAHIMTNQLGTYPLAGVISADYYKRRFAATDYDAVMNIVNGGTGGDGGGDTTGEYPAAQQTISITCTKDASCLRPDPIGSSVGWWSPSSELHLPVGHFDAAEYVARSFVYFPINFTDMVSIEAARLKVRCRDAANQHAKLNGSNSTTIYASRATKDWGEGGTGSEAVWENNFSWNWSGATKGRYDAFTTNNQASLSVSRADEYKTWNVTDIVQDWKNGSANYGFQLRNSNETGSGYGCDFFDRASGTDHAAILEIDYTTASAPNGPVSLSPTAGAVVNTLTPALSGTRSDDNSNDYCKAYEVNVYADNGKATLTRGSGIKTTTGQPANFSWTVDVTLTGNTTYYWNARTKDSADLWGPFSGVTTVRASSASGQAVLNVYQTDEVKAGDTVWINKGGGNQESKVVASSTATTITMTTNLASTHSANEAVFWLTRFKTNTVPPTPTGLSPANNSTVATLTPTFSGSSTDADPGDSLKDAKILLYSDSNGATNIWDSGWFACNSATFSKVYNGTALSPAVSYWWKAYVRDQNDQSSNPTALQKFTTQSADAPNALSPSNAKVNSLTPTMTATCSQATMNRYEYTVYSADLTTIIYGPIATDSTNLSISFSMPGGANLAWATKYGWSLRTRDSSNVWSAPSGVQAFWTNASPTATQVSPNGEIVLTLTPDFTAIYSDPDSANGFNDLPSEYVVEVSRVSDGTVMHTLTKSSNLTVGQNSVARAAEGTALSWDVDYRWRAKFTDDSGASNAAGSYSGYYLFKPSQNPTIDALAAGAGDLTAGELNNPTPTLTYTFDGSSGKTQIAQAINIIRDPGTQNEAVIYPSGGGIQWVTTSSLSVEVPNGLLGNNTEYQFVVYAKDNDNLYSYDTVTYTTTWSPPDDITGVSATGDQERGLVTVNWDQSTLSAGDFVCYVIYRRPSGTLDWTTLGTIEAQGTAEYLDYGTAIGVFYDYAVTHRKTVGAEELESSTAASATTSIDADDWYFVVQDRDDLVTIMHVDDEGHQDKVQEEVFEPFGRSRKVVVRSGVLGAEGDLSIVVPQDERETTMANLNAIARLQGTVYLKSPFGDVWIVSVGTPVNRYLGGGHVAVSLSWVEVG